jgi:hypothetical protein
LARLLPRFKEGTAEVLFALVARRGKHYLDRVAKALDEADSRCTATRLREAGSRTRTASNSAT